MCGEAQPKGAFKGMGKGGFCKGGCKGCMNAVPFDPRDPIASINAQAASFDPNFDPNAPAPALVTPAQQLAQLQNNWMSSSSAASAGPAKPVGFTSFISAPGSVAPAPIFTPAASLAPEMVMNWNVTQEDKWAGDGWVENKKTGSAKWADFSEGDSSKEDWKKVGWQDNSHLFDSDNPDDWKKAGWSDPADKKPY